MSESTALRPARGFDLDGRRAEFIDLILATLVADASVSMERYMKVVNDAINRSVDDLARETAASDQVRLAVHSFSDDAQVEIPAQSPNSIVKEVDLETRGGTAFHTAFDLLTATIPSDVASLLVERDRLQVETGRPHRLIRPVLFFLGDGQPTDDFERWFESYQRLMNLEVYPKIVTFGVENADPEIMRKISTTRHFQAKTGADVATVIVEMIGSMTRTLIDSATAGKGVIVPDHVEGADTYDSEEFLNE